MPILDPILQYQLSELTQKSEPKSKFAFIKKYLKIASKHIFQSSETIKAYIQFKKDLKNSTSLVKEFFECGKMTIDFDNSDIPNYYDFLLNLIKEDKENVEGNYYQINSFGFGFNFFQPFIAFSDQHSWFFNNSPNAILNLQMRGLNRKSFSIIKLETDIMAACGYTLVLIINEFYFRYEIDMKDISAFLNNHHFSEIHIIFDNDGFFSSIDYFADLMESIDSIYNELNSYFYLYSRVDSKSQKLNDIYNNLKTKPRFKLICFSDHINRSLIDPKVTQIDPFKYCNDGFKSDKLKVILCDVPIYNSDDSVNVRVPFDFAIYNKIYRIGWIPKSDFLYWKKSRVQIGDKSFVDFDDIHYINQEVYVKHPIYLSSINEKEMRKVWKIISQTNDKYSDKFNCTFKKEFFVTLFTESKAKKLLSYVLYAYKNSKKDFRFLKSQVYVAYKAIDFCVKNRFTSNKSGFVYQVGTGEGKSSIVKLIAAVLGLFGKTVHIVTSNIVLANRDYNDSCEFFSKLGLKSAVLVHKNELPEKYDQDIKKEHYMDKEYYGNDCFKNSMSMNFYTCGVASDKGKADIIFSNLINFESMYLYMSEKYPGRTKKYYKNSSLVIDEADLILIDELANGTILSRPLKSNSEEILSFVYKCRCKIRKKEKKDAKLLKNQKNAQKPVDGNKTKNATEANKTEDLKYKNAKDVHSHIVSKWPECTDIKVKDIEVMFKEIDLVNEDKEFVAETKYSLVPVINNDIKYPSKIIQKEVIPFNYDHTGILERNKEFSGFIQQFIALKERKLKKNIKENEVLLMKEVSMNYLYISHPIYVSFYHSVCGLTGTIGEKFDKDIFQDQYHLHTRKVPKENPNRRYQFPTILCMDEKERNQKIIDEIMGFHLKGNPVLAIFLSPSDIDEIKKGIEAHKDFKTSKVEIGIYNGKDEKIKPDKTAGAEGAISLGTNICGRGTHIDVGKKSLHIIVTFYTTNSRAMNQAFGRTSRQNNFGTVRTICLFNEFISEIKQMNSIDRENSLNMLNVFNQMQTIYIEHFRKNRKWIFDINITTQKIPTNDIRTLRSSLLNVNRINAYNFVFPLCMKYKTFLQIQAQRIFSLYNCPNSEFTWKLFQQYIREMILESWSLFLDRIERKFYCLPDKEKNSNKFLNYLFAKFTKLLNEIRLYLPDERNKLDIVQTFMHIYTKVENDYGKIILPMYNLMMPKDKTEEDKTITKPKMSMVKIGFRPYQLRFRSGSKIYNLLNDEPKISYIDDPELKYQRIGSKSKTFLSITEKIDNIFDSIYNFFSNLIGDKIGFKFFLRRTLGGCEFGICYDFDVEFDNSKIKELKNCLIDKDPLFVFSISVKSMIPFLAGVLVFFLLYLANIARQMACFVQTAMKQGIKFVKKAAVALAKFIAEKVFDTFEDGIVGKLCNYLKEVLDKQITKFMKTRNSYYLLFKMLSELLIDQIPNAAEKIYDGISPKIKINSKSTLGKLAANGMQHIFKIGFLLVLCVASFLINFQIDKSIKYDNNKVAAELTENENYKDMNRVDNYVINNEKIFNKEIPSVEPNLKA